MTLLLVAVLGAVGAVSRFIVDGGIRSHAATETAWPTIVINVTGSFVLGLLTGLATHGMLSRTAEVAAGTGFCGGYTTFSTASFETVRLWEQGERTASLVASAGTLAATLVAAGAGLAIAAWW